MISDNNMYTSVPFEKGTDARNVLETTMSNLAKQDRETVITNHFKWNEFRTSN